jgi:Fur family ferric uptake transcriptional regulator
MTLILMDATLPDVLRDLDAASLLRLHTVRPTRQRVAVVEALAAEPNDATAQDIHARLRDKVGLATVYRTLTLLSDAGVADTLNHRPGETCYRLCGEGHHHHLVCGRCHRVVELGDCDVERRLKALAAEHGFTISGHTLELTGVCASCR